MTTRVITFDDNVASQATPTSGTFASTFTEEFLTSTWVLQSDGSYELNVVHGLNNDKALFEIYDTNSQPVSINPSQQLATRIVFLINEDERFSGRIVLVI